jgi:hypothetical protein
MAKKVAWDWQSQLTETENTRLAALFTEGDALRARLDAIAAEEDAIFKAAIKRAKAAGAKLQPLKL